jgi:hypothetical protein
MQMLGDVPVVMGQPWVGSIWIRHDITSFGVEALCLWSEGLQLL